MARSLRHNPNTKLTVLDHAKLFILYLGIPFNLQYVLYVILGGVGHRDNNRKSEVGKVITLGIAGNGGYQMFLYLCLIPFLSIIYSLRDTISELPGAPGVQENA